MTHQRHINGPIIARARTLKKCGGSLRAAWRTATGDVAARIIAEPEESAWWWLWANLPALLLRCEERGGVTASSAAKRRFHMFAEGNLRGLWEEAAAARDRRGGTPPQPESDGDTKRFMRAVELVRVGELGRAAAALESGDAAKGDAETGRLLQGKHPPSMRRVPTRLRDQSAEWANDLQLDPAVVAGILRTAPRGAAADRFGWRSEYLTALLGDDDLLKTITSFFQVVARGSIPAEVKKVIAGSRLVAISKPNGDIRPIGITDVLRRAAGRSIMATIREDLAKWFVAEGGRCTQLAVGRKGGTQLLSTAVREHLANHPDHVCISLDIVNAFNSISRAAMAEAIADMPPKLRCILSFVLAMYDGPVPLTFFDDLGNAVGIIGAEGVTQGCSLAMALFAIPLHRALSRVVAAATAVGKDITIPAFADDINILGPPAVAMKVADELSSSVLPPIGCTVKYTKLLPGARVERMQLGFRALCRAARIDSPPPGFSVAHEGLRVVGAPIGTADFVMKDISDILRDHRQRLTQIASLGVSHPQEAMLLLTKTAVPRQAFICQSVPLHLAESSLLRSRDDIVDTWAAIADIDVRDVREEPRATQLSLPSRHGGVSLTDYPVVADCALVGAWAASASWLKATIPSLSMLGTEDASPPLWGGLRRAFDRLHDSGPLVRELLPPSVQDLVALETPKKLQSKLTAALHQQRFDDMHATLHRNGDLADAARVTALAAKGATAWQSVIPYDVDVQLSPPALRAAHRFQLGLPQPHLVEAQRRMQSCYCCGLPVTCVTGHHILTASNMNTSLGGRRDTHDNVVHAVSGFLRDHGFHARENGLAGLLPPDDRGHDLTVDLLVKGLSNQHLATLTDVSITHPIKGDGSLATPGIASQPLIAAGHRERQKDRKYLDASTSRGFAFTPLVLETYGGTGPDFLAFMKKVADKIIARAQGSHQERVPAGSEGDGEEALVLDGILGGAVPVTRARSQIMLRWHRKISIARVRSIAERLVGGGLDSLVG